MAYASASNVEALCQHLLGKENAFSTTSSPTRDEVTAFLSSGCAIIESYLSSYGYSVPVASGTVSYDWIRDINAYYAAAIAEMTRLNVSVQPGERTKGQVYQEIFWQNLERLLSLDLALVGGTSRSNAGSLYVGGISVDDKNTYIGNSDRVKPRFSRDQFAFPGIMRPTEMEIDDD